MLAVPKIDPLKSNIAKFRGYYDDFILFIAAFLLYIHGLTIAWNLGFEFDMAKMIIPAMAAVFWFAGALMKNSKRNWFIGVRTPWTISLVAYSYLLWRKTPSGEQKTGE